MTVSEFNPELWLPVTGYEGVYEVSNAGQVRSVDRMVHRGGGTTRKAKGVILRAAPTSTGRLTVALSLDGKHRTHLVHRLVAVAFLGSPPEGTEVCHNDGDASNNRVTNLRWDTHASNMLDAIRDGANHNTRKTVCPSGHPYAGENLIVQPDGSRKCRTCVLARVSCEVCGRTFSRSSISVHRKRMHQGEAA